MFHLVPLALLLLLVVRAVPPRRRDGAIAVALLLVALFEPTFQLTLGGSSQIAPWVPVFVWFHVAAFNLAQLALFRRHDLVSMLALRLAYYAIWHIGWGQLRLRVLF